MNFPFEEDKAIAALLYICQSMGGSCDKYALLKILYFAERKHLSTYGRPVTGDNYKVLEFGPVPSVSYDLVKPNHVNNRYFNTVDNTITAKDSPDMDFLSESDIECLTASISENRNLTFKQLKKKSHDLAYNWANENTGVNSTIPYLKIAEAEGASPEMLKYIALISENQNCNLDVNPE